MAKRLAFEGPDAEPAPQPQPGFAAALAAVEARAGSDPELEKKLRRQSMDGTLPVSLKALQVESCPTRVQEEGAEGRGASTCLQKRKHLSYNPNGMKIQGSSFKSSVGKMQEGCRLNSPRSPAVGGIVFPVEKQNKVLVPRG